jgi:hypothetical protein
VRDFEKRVRDLENHDVYFTHEHSAGGKDSEFESRHKGLWYANEVKTPCLIAFRKTRTKNDVQLATRLPKEVFEKEQKTFPRDNPVKDFLVSATATFEEYSKRRPDATRILTCCFGERSVNLPLACPEQVCIATD